jgi:ABC-type Co2+ transport system permease subunit
MMMHIEPGLVDGTKIVLSYATGAAAIGYGLKLSFDELKTNKSPALLLRAALSTALVFSFFELFPHQAVGVSEVHLILGSTLFLLLGAGPAALGLALGLLIQGLFFAPLDLPQYGMNVTTLLVPLFAVSALAKRIIPDQTPYADLTYLQALKLSTAFQGGVVAWVAFWAVYGQGFAAGNLASIATFGAAYLSVIIIEPVADLSVLALAKWLKGANGNLLQARVYAAA